MPPKLLPRHLEEARLLMFTVADRKLNMAKAEINRRWLERWAEEDRRKNGTSKTNPVIT
mgnify:CR=1 FL=1